MTSHATDGGSERFEYFMLRIHRAPGDEPGQPSGTVERLGTGWKRHFVGGGELLALLRLLDPGPADPGKMRPANSTGNAGEMPTVSAGERTEEMS